jgi:hypothetical protein
MIKMQKLKASLTFFFVSGQKQRASATKQEI